jgi:Methyltransferase domain
MKSIKGAALVTAGFLAMLYCHIVFFTVLHSQFPPACDTRSLGSMATIGLVSEDNDSAYSSALSTLRCLATPNCFPSSKCRSGVPQKIQRAKKWEEHALCTDDVLKQKDCLVYSFGIHTSWEWEEKMAHLLHCEVHAFDPTMNHPTNLAPGVTFHKLGLQADGTDLSKTHAFEYDAIDPKLLLTLGQIMARLGHVGRKLDVLALDCEGCEWGALNQLACSGESALVDQLFLELHFQKDLGLSNQVDVMKAAQGIDCLWKHRWHVVSIESSGASTENWDYAEGVTQVIYDGGFLLYLSLQRIPEHLPRPTDHLEQAIHAVRKRARAKELYSKQFATENVTQWPEEARQAWSKYVEADERASALMYKTSRRSNVQFDDHDRLKEA